jgi:hypothetical protein
MTPPTPSRGVFFYPTDPHSAQQIADVGFAKSRVWTPQSTVSLLDRIPEGMGGAILRLSLGASETAEVLRLEASDHGEGYRRYLVPMELLKHAHVTLVREE